jgi:hypothetical protein
LYKSIDDFFKWLRKIELIKDVVIRIAVSIPILIIGGVLWPISIAILGWYLYIKFGNKRIAGCRCEQCLQLSACDAKFCINCGSPIKTTEQADDK